MRKALTAQSDVTCGHRLLPAKPGAVQAASAAKLKVNGSPVLLESSVLGRPISNCATVPSQGNAPCATVASVVNTPPPKLTVSGAAVLLDSITGTTSGQVGGVTPQPRLAATANQSKLTTA